MCGLIGYHTSILSASLRHPAADAPTDQKAETSVLSVRVRCHHLETHLNQSIDAEAIDSLSVGFKSHPIQIICTNIALRFLVYDVFSLPTKLEIATKIPSELRTQKAHSTRAYIMKRSFQVHKGYSSSSLIFRSQFGKTSRLGAVEPLQRNVNMKLC